MPTTCIMDNNSISSGQQIIASSTGAMLTSLLTTPLDVVKVRLQSQVRDVSREVCSVCYTSYFDHVCGCGPQAVPLSTQRTTIPAPRFKGTIDTLLKVSRQEGIQSLWAGLSPTLVMSIPATVLYFTTYEKLKYKMQLTRCKDNAMVPIVAGAVARVCAVSVISPIELIRTKLQSEKLSYRYIYKAVALTVRQEGLISLWRGWGPTVLRDVPFSCIYWYFYETFKKSVLAKKQTKELPFGWAFLGGATAGTIAGVVTLPFDVIKTHRQIELGQLLNTEKTTEKNTEKNTKNNFNKNFNKNINENINKNIKNNSVRTEATNSLALLIKLYRQKGISSLYSGVAPRIAKVAPSCAIMISSYEFFKGYFRRRNAAKNDETPPESLTFQNK